MVGVGSVLVLSLVGAVGLTIVCQRSTGRQQRDLDVTIVVRAIVSLTSAVMVALVSGWRPAALVVGLAVWLVSRRRSGGSVSDTHRADALATWIESVRDLLLAGEQPVGAIVGSVRACPEVLRPAVRRLAAGLGRHDLDQVVRDFADDLNDPVGDLVAVGLLIALRRGARTSAVLGSLAEQVRFQSERRRLVEAERAPARREVTILVAIMVSLLAVLLLAGRSSLLDAYDSAEGQFVLVVSIAVFAALVRRASTLSVFPAPPRFLGAGLR
ncbi:MAG: hypothetical protein O2925_00510 [Actinomycetota bacterium]|nr:hypothetical protein [Actinomycetota bacterium]